MLGAGLKDMVQKFIDHNVAAIRAKGATKVVFACPSCYQMWLEYYPSEFEIFHGTQYLLNWVKEGRIQLGELDLTVTYHDTCDLGRGRVYLINREN
jgi:heterodisulfide reductase subunit D